MKRSLFPSWRLRPWAALLLALLPLWAYAQVGSVALPATPPAFTANVLEQNEPVTHSDLYCAGFLSPKLLPKDRFVAGGPDTPLQSRYSSHELIYLRGSGYEPGTRVSIVRALRDPDRFDPFPGESKLRESAGHLYGDIGYAVILENRGTNIAVAQVEFACETIVPGDQIVAFEPRQAVSFRKSSCMDRFPAAPANPVGRIVAARDFDQYPGAGHKVYLNAGADKGVKPGDYLRIVRGYSRGEMDGSDAAVLNANIAEDTQKNPPHMPNRDLKDLPRRVVGEALVLTTQPGSATAMITFALQEIQIGDRVEVEEAK